MLIISMVLLCIFSSTMFFLEVIQKQQDEMNFETLRDQVEDQNEKNEEYITQEVEQNSLGVPKQPPQILEQYKGIIQINEELAGWIKIDNTNIDYPVMHTPNDEEYYLYRNFEKEYSSSGTPFLSASNTLESENEQIVIYGHNMKNGTMFNDLLLYKDQVFWQENPYVYFDTLYSEDIYEIFAVFEIDVEIENGHFPFYQHVNFKSEKVFNDFLSEITELSLYETSITPSYGNNILTLVTCEDFSGSNRLVIMATKK